MSAAQAAPAATEPLRLADAPREGTAVAWLGSAGVALWSRGTLILVDPVLGVRRNGAGALCSEVEGMPLLREPPTTPEALATADAVLYTHADEDHMGPETAAALGRLGLRFHTTGFVARELEKLGVPAGRIVVHRAREAFRVGDVAVRMTAASHGWQETMPERYDWKYTLEDCTGFFFETPDGSVWDPGDTQLLDEHLDQPPADLLLMDYSDDPYHLGLDGALRLSERQERARLLMFHWGTFAADRPCYCADPAAVRARLRRPERLLTPPMGRWVRL